MTANEKQHLAILQGIARKAMLDNGLLIEFSAKALKELGRITASVARNGEVIRDLRGILWSSIDNDDSLDLDQLTVAEEIPGGSARIRIAVADVDSLVRKNSAIDEDARHNTTSVYTAGGIFPMLPEKLSTNLTSLNLNEDRLAIVVEMVINADGSLAGSDIYKAQVRNHAKLAYNSVAAWLEGTEPVPEPIAAISGLETNLRLQDRMAQSLKRLRHDNGALSLETVEARPVFEGDEIRGLEVERRNRATELIEDFMIAANGVTARYLTSKGFPSIRRIVRSPKRWERIVEIARQLGTRLPQIPDSLALDEFLVKQKTADPLRFPDLSLAVIKLLGSGEYLAEAPGDTAPGHFGLAVKDYTHSTAPNRRYCDLITQRLLKAAIAGKPWPYRNAELIVLARRCTEEEDTVNKIERQVGKSAAALLLQGRIAEEFDAIVTGASAKGTWVRLLQVPVEGKLVKGFEGADVGDRVHVKLVAVNVERGFIDFEQVKPSRNTQTHLSATAALNRKRTADR
ncbi:MAG: RNB domain-containing ribonuclease [Anaerolineae bacterium]